MHRLICAKCGGDFVSYEAKRKYCGHECYISKRFNHGKIKPKRVNENSERESELKGLQQTPHFRTIGYRNAERPEEWRRLLLQQTNESAKSKGKAERSEPSKINLVCGGVNMHKNEYTFASIIQARLCLNPLSGEKYVFSSKDLRQIKCMHCNGKRFIMSTRRMSYIRRIPWAGENLGKAIKITEREFEFLLDTVTLNQDKSDWDFQIS